jgi:hypothetical protein
MPWRLPRPRKPIPWTTCLVALGLALRFYHYARNPAMWHDEAALVLNVLAKGFHELLGPLLFAEAAPPLFLWLERAVALTLGESTHALRLMPFLASCAALLLLVAVARRVLRPEAVPWAVALFACSDHLLWHACEAKPYAMDVLAASVLLGLLVGLRSWPLPRQLGIYAGLAPLILGLVYPGCFLYGALLIALLPAVWRCGTAKAYLGYGVLVLAVMGSFGLLLLGPMGAQRCAMIVDCWQDSFPPWQQPWQVPVWTILSTLEIFRYCFEPAGAGLTGLAIVGAVCLWRRGERALVVFLGLPLALAYVASWLKAYPYGGTRVLVFLIPGLVLVLAESVPHVLNWLRPRSRFGTAVVGLFLLLPIGLAFYRVVDPWPRADSARAAAYVRAEGQPSDLVAVNNWESLYYFRHSGKPVRDVRNLAGESADRIWLVLGERDLRARLRLAQALIPPDCEPLARRDFTRMSVLLVARQGR